MEAFDITIDNETHSGFVIQEHADQLIFIMTIYMRLYEPHPLKKNKLKGITQHNKDNVVKQIHSSVKNVNHVVPRVLQEIWLKG